MAANESVPHDGVKRATAHEGPKKHLYAFLMSILLTVLAFIAVLYRGELNPKFVPMFIVALALIQALVQALFWMHLKDRGHFHQRLFLCGGILVAFSGVIMALYWVWWS